MNLTQTGGRSVLGCLSYAGCRYAKGMRPHFRRAEPQEAERLYDYFSACCRRHDVMTANGRFAAICRSRWSTTASDILVTV